PYRRVKVKPQRSSFLSNSARQAVGMAVAGTLLLAAGLGLYWVLNMGRTANVTGAGAPQLTADATPVKEAPKVQPKAETDAAKSPVLQKMEGGTKPSSAEQLVSTDQTQAAPVTVDMATPADDVSEGGLANRKVRTVTVRPDGTIVSGDDAVAGIEALPVERPNVPSVPSTETTNLLGDDASLLADAGLKPTPVVPAVDTSAASGAADLVADASPAAVIDPTIVAPTPMNFPVRGTTQTLAFVTPTAPRNTSVNAVVGAQTPNGQIDLLNGGAAAPAPKPKADIAAPASASTAAAYVQISSTPSEADANSQLKTATARYGSAFGGAKLVVQAANLGAKGTWYRVRLPASSLSDANRICAQIKAQGGDCIATNG
ncbi:MAG: SPOR domain-containing protein, partial [Devosia sp.]